MARLLVLMACAGPVAGFHEHIVHHVGGLFGGGGSYEEGHVPEPRYLYDELGNVIPFDPKDQHGKDCYDECESAGPCNFCGPSGACCQDGHEGDAGRHSRALTARAALQRVFAWVPPVASASVRQHSAHLWWAERPQCWKRRLVRVGAVHSK
mmetsp:Transcript_12346/g.39742  ORF Transcript_12346/g.39742 Transcript_12346/m.39742 type:complete len:152 (-) Transcript_12346:791-1246(-)